MLELLVPLHRVLLLPAPLGLNRTEYSRIARNFHRQVYDYNISRFTTPEELELPRPSEVIALYGKVSDSYGLKVLYRDHSLYYRRSKQQITRIRTPLPVKYITRQGYLRLLDNSLYRWSPFRAIKNEPVPIRKYLRPSVPGRWIWYGPDNKVSFGYSSEGYYLTPDQQLMLYYRGELREVVLPGPLMQVRFHTAYPHLEVLMADGSAHLVHYTQIYR